MLTKDRPHQINISHRPDISTINRCMYTIRQRDRPISIEMGLKFYLPGQLSLLLSTGWLMSTGQRVVKLSVGKQKAGVAHSTCG